MSAQDDRMEKRERKSKVQNRFLLTGDPDPNCEWCGGTGWANGRTYKESLAHPREGVTIFPCGCTHATNTAQEEHTS